MLSSMVKEHTAKQTARKEEQGKSIFIKKCLKNKKISRNFSF